MYKQIIDKNGNTIPKHYPDKTVTVPIEWFEGLVEMKRKIEFQEPVLRQYESRGSTPFFCTLCGMNEMKIMDNKDGDKYYCHCSYWSDPHNAYMDKSGGKWMGWKDKEYAQKLINEYPSEDNGYNQAIRDVIQSAEYIIKSNKNKK